VGIIINENLAQILILASDTIATDMQIWEMEMNSINISKLKKQVEIYLALIHEKMPKSFTEGG
jgi:hypothetical protein